MFSTGGQALHLSNGKTIDDAFSRSPVLIPRLMSEQATREPLIRVLYIRILTRQPSPDRRSPEIPPTRMWRHSVVIV